MEQPAQIMELIMLMQQLHTERDVATQEKQNKQKKQKSIK